MHSFSFGHFFLVLIVAQEQCEVHLQDEKGEREKGYNLVAR